MPFSHWLIFLLAFAAASLPASAQTSRQITIEALTEKGERSKVDLYSGSYALVIAASDYRDPAWEKLPGAKSDLPEVKAALQKQGFEVEEFAEPTSDTLLPRLDRFVRDHGFVQGNRLLIYFTGHGYTETDPETKVQYGYIVPIDAPNPIKDQVGFQQRAVSMQGECAAGTLCSSSTAVSAELSFRGRRRLATNTSVI
jgi:hypothetical protein